MSKPNKKEIEALEKRKGDDEMYHSVFDDLLEAKLMELDPEWMKEMEKLYEDSGMSRWCA